ncbi:hypothetical protein [Mycetocola zhadangensis]|nr:hypothetical protein [Mycetocola zhadangensis]
MSDIVVTAGGSPTAMDGKKVHSTVITLIEEQNQWLVSASAPEE